MNQKEKILFVQVTLNTRNSKRIHNEDVKKDIKEGSKKI